LPAEVRLYERLMTVANPDETEAGKSFKDYINPRSKEVITDARVEPSIAADPPGSRYQFERLGYFVADIEDSRPHPEAGTLRVRLVYNRIIELRDSMPVRTSQPATAATPVAAAKSAPKVANEPAKNETESRRSKIDVRKELRAATPELAARLARFTEDLGLTFEDADVLTSDLGLARFFEAALAVHDNAKSVANWVTNEVLREAKDQPLDGLPFGGAQVGRLAALVDGGAITPAIAKEVFAEMARSGGDPAAIVEARGLSPITDPVKLRPVVAQALAANPEKAAQARGGKTGLIGFFVGQVMRETRNRATPKLVQELVQKMLLEE